MEQKDTSEMTDDELKAEFRRLCKKLNKENLEQTKAVLKASSASDQQPPLAAS